MSQIVRALEGNMPLDELNEGITPGLSTVYSSASSDYNTRQYEDDLKKFRKLALESLEHDSRANPLTITSSQECSEAVNPPANLVRSRSAQAQNANEINQRWIHKGRES